MRKVGCVLAMFLIVFVISFLASNSLAGQKDIRVAVAAPVPDSVSVRLISFVQKNLNCCVEKSLLNSVDEKSILKLLSDDDLCLMIISDKKPAHWKSNNPANIDFIILNSLALLKLSAEKKELSLQALEKESLRTVVKMLGFKSCPFPRCCMCDSPDAVGRNLCPPCSLKVQKYLSEQNVKRPPLGSTRK